MSEDCGESIEHDGRAAVIDINGYYKVQVWGDPDDSLEDVMDKLSEAADQATEEIQKLNEADSNGDKSFS